jgi:ubiquinone/menaquinone biosynthesis C-methylase UbiE
MVADDEPAPDPTVRSMRDYYEQCADAYDRRTAASGGGAAGDDHERLAEFVAGLAPGRVLDVGCGTGTITRHLRGQIVALDQSQAMLGIAAARLPDARLIHADVPPLPFADGEFDRVFTSSFYSHLASLELRQGFVAEALRVASELIVVEVARPANQSHSARERHRAPDGRIYEIDKLFWSGPELAAELSGDLVLACGFIGVRTTRSRSVPADTPGSA